MKNSWNDILSKLRPETLNGMDKRDFLKPSSDAMRREKEFASRCCRYVQSLPQDQSFLDAIRRDSYASEVQKSLLQSETPVSTWYAYVAARLRFWDSLTQDFLTKEQPSLTEASCVTSSELTIDSIKRKFDTFKKDKAFLEELRKRPDWNYIPGSTEEDIAFTQALQSRVSSYHTNIALHMATELGYGYPPSSRGRRY